MIFFFWGVISLVVALGSTVYIVTYQNRLGEVWEHLLLDSSIPHPPFCGIVTHTTSVGYKTNNTGLPLLPYIILSLKEWEKEE